MSPNDLITVEVKFCYGTTSQWFVRNAQNVTVTLRRSQVILPGVEPLSDDMVTLEVPRWLVEEKGLTAK